MQLKAGCHHSIEHQGQEWHKDEEAGEQHPEYKGGDYGEGGDDDAGGLLFAFDVVLHGVSVFDYTCKGKVLFCQVLTIVNRPSEKHKLFVIADGLFSTFSGIFAIFVI